MALDVCATKLAAGPEILQLCTLLQYPGLFSRAIHKIALADSPNMNSAQEVMDSLVEKIEREEVWNSFENDSKLQEPEHRSSEAKDSEENDTSALPVPFATINVIKSISIY